MPVIRQIKTMERINYIKPETRISPMSYLVESFSGIRGIYGAALTEEIARRYAHAYASWLKKQSKHAPRIVVGMDTRASGPALKKAMIEVCCKTAKEIIDVEIATTPMIQLAVRKYKADGGIIITASHNEPEFNGWKFLGSNGAALKAESMHAIIKKAKKAKVPAKKAGNCNFVNKSMDIGQKYREFVLGTLGKEMVKRIRSAGFRLVVDPNGGSSWKIIADVLSDLKITGRLVAAKPGEFHRRIEPNENSLSYMGKIVREEKADFGIGFDCDADRAEFVLPFGENIGKVISGHYLLAILADYMLPGAKNRVVVTNDATSQVVGEIVKKHKGRIYEVEVGEANVMEEMKKRKACLGGEGSSSGGIVPPSTSRDGILGMAMLLGIMATGKKSLSKIIEKLPQYYTLQTKALLSKERMQDLKHSIREYFKGYKVTETGDETGGIKVWADDSSWIWFRDSKTEPGVVRIIADSKSEEKSNELIILGRKALGIGTNVC
ncbi:MAG: phosphoglucomutase (pgm), phosphomannomutase / phosphoglucomutase [archaeon GW2011_AR3]|nr:MAG: phosphoglucomutase (pgm), phosphomannomutase / phosphoglucomutase [archaeon GW2011_AR3]